jgi:hypothetical protein
MDSIEAAKIIWETFRTEKVKLKEAQTPLSLFATKLQKAEQDLEQGKENLKKSLKSKPELQIDKDGNTVIANATIPVNGQVKPTNTTTTQKPPLKGAKDSRQANILYKIMQQLQQAEKEGSI